MGRAVQTVNIDDEDDDREDDFHNIDDREDDDRDVWRVYIDLNSRNGWREKHFF